MTVFKRQRDLGCIHVRETKYGFYLWRVANPKKQRLGIIQDAGTEFPRLSFEAAQRENRNVFHICRLAKLGIFPSSRILGYRESGCRESGCRQVSFIGHSKAKQSKAKQSKASAPKKEDHSLS